MDRGDLAVGGERHARHDPEHGHRHRPERVPALGHQELEGLARRIAADQRRRTAEQDPDHRIGPGELLAQIRRERIRAVSDGDQLGNEDSPVAMGREDDRVEMVFGARRLKASDLVDRRHPVRRVRPDDERRHAVAVEAHLQRALEHQLLLGQPPGRPVLEVAADARSLDPSDLGVSEVPEHAVEVVSPRVVIDVQLDEDLVAEAA